MITLRHFTEAFLEEKFYMTARKPDAGEDGDRAPKVDKVVAKVRADLLSRSELGIKKYGTVLNENAQKDDLLYWLQHAYEETLDQANYLQCAIMNIKGEM